MIFQMKEGDEERSTFQVSCSPIVSSADFIACSPDICLDASMDAEIND